MGVPIQAEAINECQQREAEDIAFMPVVNEVLAPVHSELELLAYGVGVTECHDVFMAAASYPSNTEVIPVAFFLSVHRIFRPVGLRLLQVLLGSLPLAFPLAFAIRYLIVGIV
jgi:hypothetical protein